MSEDRILATYLIETPHSLEHAAAVIAGEQSSGTFVSVPGETQRAEGALRRAVERVEPLDTVDSPSLPGCKAAAARSGPHRSIGAVSSSSRFRCTTSVLRCQLARPRWPAISTSCRSCRACAWWISSCRRRSPTVIRGPASVSTARASSRRSYGRPLIGTIVKPSIGLSTEQLRTLVRDLASAGLDFIKDDELHADPPYAPLAERVPAVMAEIERVADATGKKSHVCLQHYRRRRRTCCAATTW